MKGERKSSSSFFVFLGHSFEKFSYLKDTITIWGQFYAKKTVCKYSEINCSAALLRIYKIVKLTNSHAQTFRPDLNASKISRPSGAQLRLLFSQIKQLVKAWLINVNFFKRNGSLIKEHRKNEE